MEQDYKYMVATRCFTYNQAPYIEDALHGFAMQETTFPVVFCIVDDASTDGEPEVLRKWAKENLDLEKGGELWKDVMYGYIIEAPLKGKSLINFVILLLKENYRSRHKAKKPLVMTWINNAKYVALCEGDDFWINPYKLQKQTDLFLSNPGMTYCFSNRIVRYEITGHDRIVQYSTKKYTQKDFLSGFNPGIQTAMYEQSCINNIDCNLYKGVNADRLLPYLCTMKGYALCLQEETAVYRVTPKGVSNSVALNSTPSAYFKHVCDDFYFFHEKIGFPYKKGYMKASANYAMRYLAEHRDFDFHFFCEMTSRYNGRQTYSQFIGTMGFLVVQIFHTLLKKIGRKTDFVRTLEKYIKVLNN